MIALAITLIIVVGVLFFYLGVRYALTRLLPDILPGLLAQMTPEELRELAKKAAGERPEN